MRVVDLEKVNYSDLRSSLLLVAKRTRIRTVCSLVASWVMWMPDFGTED